MTTSAPPSGTLPDGVDEVARGVFRIADTCNVYLIVADSSRASEVGADAPDAARTAIAIDFGSGLVLDHLERLGVSRITDVLMTHHHRDQGQGLPLAVDHGARIHVPPVEVELFTRPDELWQSRQLENDYNVRQNHFSLLEPVAIEGIVPEYRIADFGGIAIRTVPTPGHTVGSVTYLLDRDDSRIAFTGDLIYAPGKVWSLAATQWSYTGHEGPAMNALSCDLLRDEAPDMLLPSHGGAITDPASALGLLRDRLQRYVDSRRPTPWDLELWLRSPYVSLSPHLLRNRSSVATSYVLLSETGEALLIDYGYDMTTGLPTGTERSARRPWLASLPALKEQFGVTRISVALPTHYHDDHVAGMPLLREVEGTEIWAPSNVAPVLVDPWLHDLPCQWFEPIHPDRVLPVGESFAWNEYTITVHDQPGHTLFAAAFEVEVDGVTVMFTGDQQENLGVPGERNEVLNYQYRNRFRITDYRDSGRLYRRVAPGLLLSGHWQPRAVDDGYLDFLLERGEDLADLHETLLPLDELDLGSDGVLVRLAPHRSRAVAGERMSLAASVRNPHAEQAEVILVPVLPEGWSGAQARVTLGALEERDIRIDLVAGQHAGRARVALDVTIGLLRLGQHAEAIVEVAAGTP